MGDLKLKNVSSSEFSKYANKISLEDKKALPKSLVLETYAV